MTIAGVQVGGLTRAAAREAVLAQYVAPRRAKVPVTFRGRTLAIDPVTTGYTADVDYALDGALLFGRSKPLPPEGVTVPLRQKVDRKRLRAVLSLRAATYDLPAKDASLSFTGPPRSSASPGWASPSTSRRRRRPSSRRSWSGTARSTRSRPSACARRHLRGARDHHRAQRLPPRPLARR